MEFIAVLLTNSDIKPIVEVGVVSLMSAVLYVSALLFLNRNLF